MVPLGAYTEKTTAEVPLLPALDFVQVNTLVAVFPEIVNVKVILPVSTAVPPRSEDAATDNSIKPAAVAVAAVFVFNVMPVGKVPTAQVQAVCVIPTYPVNGMEIVEAADVLPADVQAMDCVSFPKTMEIPPLPAEPVAPLSPLAPS